MADIKELDYNNKIGSVETDIVLGGDPLRKIYYDGTYAYDSPSDTKHVDGIRPKSQDLYIIQDADITSFNTLAVGFFVVAAILFFIISVILLADKNSWGSYIAFMFYAGIVGVLLTGAILIF